MVIVGLDYAANLVDLGFWTVLRLYLFAVESALVVALYLTLVSSGAERGAVRRALLVGIALNPVTIILVCQHGNSDVQVGLVVTLAVAALGAHGRSRDVVMWLAAACSSASGSSRRPPRSSSRPLGSGRSAWSNAGRALGAVLFWARRRSVWESSWRSHRARSGITSSDTDPHGLLRSLRDGDRVRALLVRFSLSRSSRSSSSRRRPALAEVLARPPANRIPTGRSCLGHLGALARRDA